MAVRQNLVIVSTCAALAVGGVFLAIQEAQPRTASPGSLNAAAPFTTMPRAPRQATAQASGGGRTPSRDAPAIAPDDQHDTEKALPAASAPPEQTPLQARPSMRSQVLDFLRQMEDEAGPAMAEHAREMMCSTSAVMRAVGSILLAKARTLDERDLNALANHEDLSVPLTVLEWLRDSGRLTEADGLHEKLQQRGVDDSAVVSLLADGGLRVAGGRLILDMLQPGLAPDKAQDLYLSLACDDKQDYGLRMKSALYLRDVVPFEEYRLAVNDMTNATNPGEPLWADGLQRLAERLEGPKEVVDAPPSLTLEDVNSLLARENPTDLEDLALQVEYVVGHANARVSAGTSARLAARLAAMKEDPLSDDDLAAHARVEQMMDSMSAIEKARPAPPSPGPPPVLPDDDEPHDDDSDGG